MSLLPYCYNIDYWKELERHFFFRDEFFKWNPIRPLPSPVVPQDVFRHIVNPMEHLASAMNQLAVQDMGSSLTVDDSKFQVNVDVQHFAPDEISVKVIDGQVMIEGKHEEKRDEHGFISRQFVRKYALPKGCLPDAVKSTLSSDGVLIVSAPKVLPLPSIGEKIIPIVHTGPVQKQLSMPSGACD